MYRGASNAPVNSQLTNINGIDFDAGIGIVEMLGRSNYVALVGGGKQPKFPPNHAIIWDDNKSKVAFTLKFNSLVLRVRLSRSRIVVALNDSIHIYAFSSPPAELAVYETTPNPLGLCCLTSKYIVFPGQSSGQVKIVEIETRNVAIIPAHSTPLRALALSQDSELLATASETGTLIRVFSTANCARITELRRGMESARIFSIAISPSSALLAVTSDKSTLHVFDLPRAHHPSSDYGTSVATMRNRGGSPTQPLPGNPSSSSSSTAQEGYENRSWGLLSRIPLLPRAFSDVYSFTTAHFEIGDEASTGPGVPAPAKESMAAISGIVGGVPQKGVIGWLSDDKLVVIGAGRDGRWEKFLLAVTEDGKRVLVKEGWKRYLGAY